ncbi:type II and III secretion system protein family protein [Edaphovirga cremea]|uniref:type II and III secretion system protein family protein n=1 Tax=Edaphovirga cremea TaxID=2267246 RepID=UPI000DEEE685|nr:pilus assembly protein N-terminal domain-containing protein [Edaphovirga cremea]
MIRLFIRTRPLSLLPLLFALFFSAQTWASQTFLKVGQSKTYSVKEKIDTVFISNPAVADYKILNDKSVVLYAKKMGISELTVYGKNSRILLNTSIGVDPFLGDITQRVAKQFPGSQVEINRFVSDDKVTYILSGTVIEESDRDAIYQVVGSLVGGEGKENKLSYDGEGIKSDNITFMTNKTYDNVINRIQLPSSNQVNVRLTVVEVTKEFKESLGVEWSSLTLDSIINGDSVANPPGTFSLLGFKRGFDASNISNIINAVKNDNIARVLAQPNLTVLSGETASFLVGGEIPIMVKDADSVTVQYKEFGIRLNIAAKVEKRQKIKLFVSNELSSVTGSYAYNDYQVPTMRTRKSSSTIELGDGDSFVLGGLLSEEDKESLTKVPFIGDLPILGALARSSSTERSKSELVVFATVNLVKPTSSARQIQIPLYKRTSTERLFFNVGVNKEVREGRLSSDASSFMAQGGFAK